MTKTEQNREIWEHHMNPPTFAPYTDQSKTKTVKKVFTVSGQLKKIAKAIIIPQKLARLASIRFQHQAKPRNRRTRG